MPEIYLIQPITFRGQRVTQESADELEYSAGIIQRRIPRNHTLDIRCGTRDDHYTTGNFLRERFKTLNRVTLHSHLCLNEDVFDPLKAILNDIEGYGIIVANPWDIRKYSAQGAGPGSLAIIEVNR